MLTLLQRIGGLVPAKLHGELIHRLSNIITLDVNQHVGFDSLEWWMEPVPSGVRLTHKCVNLVMLILLHLPRNLTTIKYTISPLLWAFQLKFTL